jgi:hypothetical protein
MKARKQRNRKPKHDDAADDLKECHDGFDLTEFVPIAK